MISHGRWKHACRHVRQPFRGFGSSVWSRNYWNRSFIWRALKSFLLVAAGGHKEGWRSLVQSLSLAGSPLPVMSWHNGQKTLPASCDTTWWRRQLPADTSYSISPQVQAHGTEQKGHLALGLTLQICCAALLGCRNQASVRRSRLSQNIVNARSAISSGHERCPISQLRGGAGNTNKVIQGYSTLPTSICADWLSCAERLCLAMWRMSH